MFVCQIHLSQSLNKFQRHMSVQRWWGYWLCQNEDIHWLIILIDIWYHTGSESNIIIFLFIIWNQHVPALPRRWWLCFPKFQKCQLPKIFRYFPFQIMSWRSLLGKKKMILYSTCSWTPDVLSRQESGPGNGARSMMFHCSDCLQPSENPSFTF